MGFGEANLFYLKVKDVRSCFLSHLMSSKHVWHVTRWLWYTSLKFMLSPVLKVDNWFFSLWSLILVLLFWEMIRDYYYYSPILWRSILVGQLSRLPSPKDFLSIPIRNRNCAAFHCDLVDCAIMLMVVQVQSTCAWRDCSNIWLERRI